jgi:hypothetical protein
VLSDINWRNAKPVLHLDIFCHRIGTEIRHHEISEFLLRMSIQTSDHSRIYGSAIRRHVISEILVKLGSEISDISIVLQGSSVSV